MAEETKTVDNPQADLQNLLNTMDDDGNITAQPDKVEPTPPNTETVTPAETEKKVEENAAETLSPETASDSTMYAGKYKDEEALLKGVDEIVKALKLPETVVKKLIDPLKEQKDFKAIEAQYLELASEYDRRKAAEKVEPVQPDATTPEPTTVEFDKLPVTERVKVYSQALSLNSIKDLFDEAGLTLPNEKQIESILTGRHTQDKELMTLKLEYPGYFAAFVEVLNDTYKVASLYQSQEPAILKAKTEGKQFINEFNKKHSLDLKEPDIDAIINKIMEMPEAYQDNYGIRLPRKDAVKKLFYSENLEPMLDKISLAAESRGRTQKQADDKKIDEKIISTASTSGKQSASRDKVGKKETPNDPNILLREIEKDVEKIKN